MLGGGSSGRKSHTGHSDLVFLNCKAEVWAHLGAMNCNVED